MALDTLIGQEDKKRKKADDKPSYRTPWYTSIADFVGAVGQTAADVGMGLALFSGYGTIPAAYYLLKGASAASTGVARLSKTVDYARGGDYWDAAKNLLYDVVAYALPGGTAVKYIAGERGLAQEKQKNPKKPPYNLIAQINKDAGLPPKTKKEWKFMMPFYQQRYA